MSGGRSWLNPTIPCCEKEFVSCEEGEISQIEWGSIHGLRGTLPAQLGLLTSLKEIDVERTAVSGTLPVALASAASGLRRLKIKQTNITGTLPPSLFLSGTLEELSAKQACAYPSHNPTPTLLSHSDIRSRGDARSAAFRCTQAAVAVSLERRTGRLDAPCDLPLV